MSAQDLTITMLSAGCCLLRPSGKWSQISIQLLAYSVAFHTANVLHICLIVCPSHSFEGVVGGVALNLHNAHTKPCRRNVELQGGVHPGRACRKVDSEISSLTVWSLMKEYSHLTSQVTWARPLPADLISNFFLFMAPKWDCCDILQPLPIPRPLTGHPALALLAQKGWCPPRMLPRVWFSILLNG